MTNRPAPLRARIPSATYRLQFNREFTFAQAAAIVDYLHELGISDCYASPLLLARSGSPHGYDVTGHSRLNPEIGTEEEFIAFAERLKAREMGVMMDVVPNHMCIAGGENRRWNDVLENGPSSQFAEFFDIDWQPPKPDLANKVLLPMLGEQYGRVMENQEIKLSYQRGAFSAHYYETRLPVSPRSYTQILELVLSRLREEVGEYHAQVLELESIITAIRHLPPRTETDPAKIKERRREKEIIKRRLASLTATGEAARSALREALREFNGAKGDPRSFDRLEALLAAQAYRLSYWRVAADEINYRRFFDINELAAIRVETPAVFASVHEVILRLMKQGFVTGLRIDHVDGLLDPAQYLRDLQRASLNALALARSEAETGRSVRGLPNRQLAELASANNNPCYVVVEKILGQHETLRQDWPVHGTTGYEFLNMLNGVFVDSGRASAFRRIYERFTGNDAEFDDLTYECKKLILRVALSSELNVLARRLDRISEQHRYSRDFTLNSLQYALGELIACFPVYRSYINAEQTAVTLEDRGHILTAVRAAKRRNPATSPSLFDFIGSILVLDEPDGLTDAERAMRRNFVSRFQQLTGPVMAKGLEDTAFYRCYPLASLNEVGGEPGRFGVSLESFHSQNQRRARQWMHSLSATSTHDTKRSEDVRARINVLSEMPGRWYRAVRRWQNLNRAKKAQLDEAQVPDANEEYLLYQTLVGVWPLLPLEDEAHARFVQRIEDYLIKAIREAKLHSSWINMNEGYEQAVRQFIRAILEPTESNDFLKSFAEFQPAVARAGMVNSLSQTLLKITLPGVPDLYQGTEVWDFHLVDPDNRQPVDYARRRELLASLPESASPRLADDLLRHMPDGRLKLYLTRQALRFRRAHRELFEHGEYVPLRARGEHKTNVIAFARVIPKENVLVAAARFPTRLGEAGQYPVGAKAWKTTMLQLPEGGKPGCYRDILTGRDVCTFAQEEKILLPVAEVFAHLPVALLEQTQ